MVSKTNTPSEYVYKEPSYTYRTWMQDGKFYMANKEYVILGQYIIFKIVDGVNQCLDSVRFKDVKENKIYNMEDSVFFTKIKKDDIWPKLPKL